MLTYCMLLVELGDLSLLAQALASTRATFISVCALHVLNGMFQLLA
jgi:hypothetical protein